MDTVEKLRKEYYWGDTDKEKYKFDSMDLSRALNELWNIRSIHDVDSILGEAFQGYAELYRLVKDIISEYIFNCHSNNLIERYRVDFEKTYDTDIEWYLWDLLRRIFMGVNAQYFAGIARNRAERSVLENKDKNYSLLLRKYSIYVSRGDWENACASIDRMMDRGLREEWPDRYSQLIDYHETLIKGKVVADSYGKYIANKDIVIMGVAPHTNNEKHDNMSTVHVFINYSGEKHMVEADKGVSANISYYNIENARTKLTKDAVFIDDLDFIVCKAKITDNFVALRNANKVRYAFPLMFGCPFGHPLLMSIMVYDLAHYNYADLYITHMNCYYSDRPYDEGYYQLNSSEFKKFLLGMASHDLIGNWLQLKTWYEKGVFRCDDELRTVLSLTEEEYTIGLENTFRRQLGRV